jgi:hypothetical protein
MRHDPGLAASPPVRYMLKVERSGYSPFPGGTRRWLSHRLSGPSASHARAALRCDYADMPSCPATALTAAYSVG